jgi:hypothetical protein
MNVTQNFSLQVTLQRPDQLAREFLTSKPSQKFVSHLKFVNESSTLLRFQGLVKATSCHTSLYTELGL